MTTNVDLERMEQAAEIVAAYVAHNPIAATSLPEFISTVHNALVGLGQPSMDQPDTIAAAPAVSIKKSVTPDAIVCLDCGKKFKSLKRHISTSHGLTPDLYRAKWGLPSDYPMVAPNYSSARSSLAKSIGLGTKR